MEGAGLDDLAAFARVARERSFRAAAAEAGVSASALSHRIRGLEARLGVRLLNRTTRSVALTDAGERLLSRLGPALAEIGEALEGLNAVRDRPSGVLRLNMSRHAAAVVLAPVLARFLAAYPEVALEVSVDDGLSDIVAAGFDAGVRFGETLERDMVAVPVSGPVRFAVVGSPGYFERRPRPASPRDLADHACVRLRLRTSRAVYRWEFEKDGEAVDVAVEGPLTVDDGDLAIRAALDGVGLAFAGRDRLAAHLADGRLVSVLDDWCPPFPGFFLYRPSRRQTPAALRALLAMLRAPGR